MNAQIAFSFIEELDLSSDVKNRLSPHLKSIVSGDETVYVSPLSLFISDIILKELDKVFAVNKTLINSNLQNLEEYNLSNSSQSLLLYFGRKDIQEQKNTSIMSIQSKVDYRRSFRTQQVQVPRLRTLSTDNALSFTKNNINCDLPFYTKRGLVKDKYRENFTEFPSRKDPRILFTRTQEQKKTRVVFGFPMSDTVNEMRYYCLVFDYQSKLNWRSAFRGSHDVDISLTKLVSMAIDRKDKLMSLDFSAYNSTINPKLQETFNYFSFLFRFHHRPELDVIARRFGNIGIVTPDGVIQRCELGVISSSTLTNEVNSIVRYIIARSHRILDDQIDIHGYDGVYRLSYLEALKEAFESYSLKFNEAKSSISDTSLVHLRNLYGLEYMKDGIIGGIYPTYRALNRIIYLEKFDGFSEDKISELVCFAIRIIAILENCKHHPLLEEFVRFIYSKDKYKLNYSGLGLSNHIKRVTKTRGALDQLYYHYGNGIRGIVNFGTFNLIGRL